MIELCEIADRGGMHAIWTGEHHGHEFHHCAESFINLADLPGAPRGCGSAPAPSLRRSTRSVWWARRR
ncbi:hypothetical protein M8494_11090 [Serratia ureilytica]